MNYKKIIKWIRLSLKIQYEQYRLAADLQATNRELVRLKAYVNDYESIAIAPLIAMILANSNDVSKEQIEEVIGVIKEHDNPTQAFFALLSADPVNSNFPCRLPYFRELLLNKISIDKEIIKALGWRETITIVDVGAQMLESSDHVYSNLVKSAPTSIIGFEPLSDEIEKRVKAEKNVKIYPYMIGDGEKRKFNITKFTPASSNKMPNFSFLKKFHALYDMLRVEETIDVDTMQLDDIKQLKKCDLLKLDVQGSELDVLKGAKETLINTCVIYVEVEHSEVYVNQPLHSEIDIYLREAGFSFIDYKDSGYITYCENNRGYGGSRRAWADAIYFKNDEGLLSIGAKKILKAAIIAHCNYAMWDLTAHYLKMYDEMTGSNLSQKYIYKIDEIIYPLVDV